MTQTAAILFLVYVVVWIVSGSMMLDVDRGGQCRMGDARVILFHNLVDFGVGGF